MSLQITDRQTEGISVLTLSGRLVLGEEAAKLQDALDLVVNSGRSLLLVDLARVSFIDSSGLGVLVGAYSAFQKLGGAVKILHASQKHVELLVLTKLTTIFQLYDDERTAIDSFFPDRDREPFDILKFVQQQESKEPDKLT